MLLQNIACTCTMPCVSGNGLRHCALQLGIATELIEVWGQSIDSERSKLKDEKFFSGENEQVQAEILSRILVRKIVPCLVHSDCPTVETMTAVPCAQMPANGYVHLLVLQHA